MTLYATTATTNVTTTTTKTTMANSHTTPRARCLLEQSRTYSIMCPRSSARRWRTRRARRGRSTRTVRSEHPRSARKNQLKASWFPFFAARELRHSVVQSRSLAYRLRALTQDVPSHRGTRARARSPTNEDVRVLPPVQRELPRPSKCSCFLVNNGFLKMDQ